MSQPQWTVSIIAQFTASKKEEFVSICYRKLIDSIKAHRNPNVNFYVLKYNSDDEVSEFITYDFVTANRNRRERVIQRKSTKNFYDSPKVMIEFFKDCSLKSKAKHHFVITVGHGAGFGTFAEGYLQEVSEGLMPKDLPKAILFYKRLFSSGSVTPEDNNKRFTKVMGFLTENDLVTLNLALQKKIQDDFRIVTIELLAEALSATFGKAKKKVDFLYSMSCYMQMFETGFHLKKLVKFYAASETFQFFPGPDYDALFRDLSASGHADLHKLSAGIIENYNAKYARPEIQALLAQFSASMAAVMTQINEVFLSIIDFKLHKECADQVNVVAHYFIKKRKKLYPIIREVRERCTEVSLICLGIIDIAHFCMELLRENLTDALLVKELRKLIAIIHKSGGLIAARRYTPALCVPNKIDDVMQSMCPQGISVFFPKDRHRTELDQYVHFFMDEFYTPHGKQPKNIFLNSSHWDDFVRDYYDSFTDQ